MIERGSVKIVSEIPYTFSGKVPQKGLLGQETVTRLGKNGPDAMQGPYSGPFWYYLWKTVLSDDFICSRSQPTWGNRLEVYFSRLSSQHS
jgi:hypothetical protein